MNNLLMSFTCFLNRFLPGFFSNFVNSSNSIKFCNKFSMLSIFRRNIMTLKDGPRKMRNTLTASSSKCSFLSKFVKGKMQLRVTKVVTEAYPLKLNLFIFLFNLHKPKISSDLATKLKWRRALWSILIDSVLRLFKAMKKFNWLQFCHDYKSNLIKMNYDLGKNQVKKCLTIFWNRKLALIITYLDLIETFNINNNLKRRPFFKLLPQCYLCCSQRMFRDGCRRRGRLAEEQKFKILFFLLH